MNRILIVDDEAKIRSIIRKYAEFEGYEIEEARDGQEAVEMCEAKHFDLIIMDVMMPQLNGFAACVQIREKKDIPVIMLSAKGEEYDKIHGFEAGVDDYVVKPFSPKELMLRINVVISRHRKQRDELKKRDVFTYKGLSVDFTGRSVTVDGERVLMTPKEYELLFYMIRNQNIALTRENLITNVWGYDYYGDDRTLDTHVKLLRSSLRDYRRCIITLRGVGYRFET